jgi:hypothetical protein
LHWISELFEAILQRRRAIKRRIGERKTLPVTVAQLHPELIYEPNSEFPNSSLIPEAHATLQPVFSGFSEGLDTPDLLDAGSLPGN